MITIRAFLSHYPKLYAFIVGVGIVLFWRGIWHSVDTVHEIASHYHFFSSIDTVQIIWWDGPLSLLIGTIILYFSGAFISSFIGNELILSGLRGEKKFNEQTETAVKTEVRAIADIKEELIVITQKIQQLEESNIRAHQKTEEKSITD